MANKYYDPDYDPDYDLDEKLCEECDLRYCAFGEALCIECLADELEEDDYWNNV